MEGSTVIMTTVTVLALVFIPGLSLTLAFFPRWSQITTPERLGLSFILGLTPALLLYFLDKNLWVPFNSTNSALAYAAVTATGLVVWHLRRGGSFINKRD
jgi:hypothetical protein